MNPTLRRVRIGLWLAVIGALAGWLWLNATREPAAQTQGTAPIAGPAAQIGGPFTLTDENGQLFSSQMLAGRPWLIFFGFTQCPDICPTSMFGLATALKDIDAPADFRVLFVTVDPQRDTPDILKSYTDAFDPRIVGLTGSEADVAAVAKAFRAFYRRVPTSSGYTMDHTASIYMMDAKGQFVGTLAHGEKPEIAAAKLRKLLERAGS